MSGGSGSATVGRQPGDAAARVRASISITSASMPAPAAHRRSTGRRPSRRPRVPTGGDLGPPSGGLTDGIRIRSAEMLDARVEVEDADDGSRLMPAERSACRRAARAPSGTSAARSATATTRRTGSLTARPSTSSAAEEDEVDRDADDEGHPQVDDRDRLAVGPGAVGAPDRPRAHRRRRPPGRPRR